MDGPVRPGDGPDPVSISTTLQGADRPSNRMPKSREAGPGGPADFSLVVGTVPTGRSCGTPLRSVSSFALRRPLTCWSARRRKTKVERGHSVSCAPVREGTENRAKQRTTAIKSFAV